MQAVPRFALVVVILFACMLLATCSKETPEDGTASRAGDERAIPVVYAVNYPLMYFAERIGGGLFDVRLPAMEGDPVYWKPTPEAVRRLQGADLILLNGATYAKWVDKVTLSEEKMVDTSKGFREKYIVLVDAVTHIHGPEGAHEHTGTAFTTWLDLTLAIEHARAIQEAFASLQPDKKVVFRQGFAALERDLNDLDHKIKGIVSADKSQPLIVSHPVYQYFTRRYGLNVKSVHWEPDERPDASMLTMLEKLHADHPAEWMIWEGDPMAGVVERLEKIGLKSLVFDPCGNAPEEGDFLSIMTRNVENLRAAF